MTLDKTKISASTISEAGITISINQPYRGYEHGRKWAEFQTARLMVEFNGETYDIGVEFISSNDWDSGLLDLDDGRLGELLLNDDKLAEAFVAVASDAFLQSMPTAQFVAARFHGDGLIFEDCDGIWIDDACDMHGKRVASHFEKTIWEFNDGSLIIVAGGCWDILVERFDKWGQSTGIRCETNPEFGEPPIADRDADGHIVIV